jgi:hypothetical protein
MLKALWLLALLCLFLHKVDAQHKKPSKNKFTDSAQFVQENNDPAYELPVITVHETERSETGVSFVPGLLYANRDLFMNTAAFHFSVTRFKMRGYSTNLFNTQINGMQMNNLDDGNTQWSLWGGLNDVTRNTQTVLGLRPAEQGFGNMGSLTSIDMRASKQWAQTQVGYAFSNRTYTHRWSFTKSTGFNKKGWAFSFSGSWRMAAEGYMPGTDYRSGSYFMGIDKKLNDEHLLSFLFFGNAMMNGKQGPVLKESVELSGSFQYNPYWGYQSGRKRNANEAKSHQPVMVITHEHRINNNTSFVTTLGVVMGEKSSTALDWYKASDPRPDYYRYLPSYQKDSALRFQVADAMMGNSSLRQINWDHLYDVNRHSMEILADADGISGNSVSGLRSHYIVEERVTNMKRVILSTVFNTRLNEVLGFSGGASYQVQQSHFFKRMCDLLGGDYYVDLNQFAERDFPDDVSVIQNDLQHPNRTVRRGDVYGYDYLANTSRITGWAQITRSKKKLDDFIALEISTTTYDRNGKMKNGLFPFNSFGRSKMIVFTNYALKAGITYKISGRKYLYVHGSLMTKAPLFDDVFISPRTRDTRQENIQNEIISSIEPGFVCNAPRFKLRVSAYLTGFTGGMNVMTFYHDGYGNFVNYALSGIDKIHYGTELGMEWKLTNRFTLNAVASAGRYYYNSRQHVSVSADNDAYILENALIYSQNFRVEGTPQEAYNIGISYQSRGAFYCNLSGNYFTQQWLSFNPLRRTYSAMENVTEGSEQWNRIINQTLVPDQYTVDLSAGTSARLKLFHSKQRQTLLFNININNLLNKQDIVSSGYEQLRFDADTKNTDKFPPKYFYAMGLNFSASLSLRL